VTWLIASLALSIVLTVAVNLALRIFPNLGSWIARRWGQLSSAIGDPHRSARSVKVIVPWKAMIVASVVLTAAFYFLRSVT
jgi:hypothetical protein